MGFLPEQSNARQQQPDSAPNISCPHCGGDQLFVRKQPPHIALRCASCQRWIKWVSRSASNRFPQEPAVKPSPALKLVERVDTEPAKPAASTLLGCGHCGEISRLLNHLVGIERHLEIVTRALTGSLRS
jgi:DNA-directed RNA polymerase subunit M/transcription elongation factor TFIIS